MSKNNFQQFIKKEDKGARLKEKIRQEKKKVRQETKEFFAQQKLKAKQFRTGRPALENEADSDGNNFKSRGPARRTGGYGSGNSRDSRKPAADRDSRKPTAGHDSRNSAADRDSRKPTTGHDSRKPAAGRDSRKPVAGRPSRPLRPEKSEPRHSQYTRSAVVTPRDPDKHPAKQLEPGTRNASSAGKTVTGRRIPVKKVGGAITQKGAGIALTKSGPVTAKRAGTVPETLEPITPKDPGQMPLNKYVSHAGISSRRDAAEIVRSGKVSVNGEVVTEPGFKVSPRDEIKFQGNKITPSRNMVYILLNKPKDHITTTNDPEGRKTVMDIVKKATDERVYPIGRLDRNTTGVLVLTNDGELAQKLSHPSYQVRKIYEVTLDKPLVKKDFDELLNGITLDDGFIAPDSLAYADSKDKTIIGIEIHSGKNRIVRRMFEKLGYDVRNLDRVMYAGLTKKNVERGKWRFLQEKEVRLLKFMNASYSRKK